MVIVSNVHNGGITYLWCTNNQQVTGLYVAGQCVTTKVARAYIKRKVKQEGGRNVRTARSDEGKHLFNDNCFYTKDGQYIVHLSGYFGIHFIFCNENNAVAFGGGKHSS
jgi:hypothetical protein